MNNLVIAQIAIDGLIAGIESNSSIPPQLSEFVMLKKLLEAHSTEVVKMHEQLSMSGGRRSAKMPMNAGDHPRLGAVNSTTVDQPPLRAVHQGLFPTLSSLQSVVDFAYSQMPVNNNNAMLNILMVYQNTLLAQLNPKKEA